MWVVGWTLLGGFAPGLGVCQEQEGSPQRPQERLRPPTLPPFISDFKAPSVLQEVPPPHPGGWHSGKEAPRWRIHCPWA